MTTTSPKARLQLWQGEFVDDAEAERRLAGLSALADQVLADPLPVEVVLAACATLSEGLRDVNGAVRARLAPWAGPEDDGVLDEVAAALDREALERKVRRELGGLRPDRLTRPDARETVYEAWAPVGLLAHVAPGNAASVAPLSVVEGLLTGNLNVLKVSASDSPLALRILAELGAADPTGRVAERIVALRFPSARREWLRLMCAHADAVAAWGGEEAVAAVAELVPPGCRVVEWGHRISFAYLTTRAAADDGTLDALAGDVCRFEQQACSSPQVVYLDTAEPDEVFAFAERFAARLAKVSGRHPAAPSSVAERAEVTTTELVARLEEHLGLTRVFAAEDGSWRVLADSRPALTASPLHRSVWVKPLPRHEAIATLRPMRRYLQTAAVGGGPAEAAEVARVLLAAGVTRITPVGSMPDGYPGEPHDGVYPLQRYSRRVAVRAEGAGWDAVACLDDLAAPPVLPPAPTGPLLGKADVQRALATLDDRHAHLYFRSGGTTGAPALSVFTNADYDHQMRVAADGLLAAGFDPARDRAANLFYCGAMYGSFISFFSVFERLNATQIPMAAGTDHAAVAEALVAYRVDTVFGMPSYLWQLFHAEADRLRAYGGIRKVFYGGEHFTARQRRVLTEEFGVEVIRSAAYGSTDLGPLGYQCTSSEGSVHHVLTDLHTLEVLDREEDRPVAPGEPGRLVFTSRARLGQRLERYEIGDLGRLVPGRCPCGSHAPRVELLGRYGDVVRAGTYFFNYRRFVTVADEALDYTGELQLVLSAEDGRERLTLRMDERYAPEADVAREAFLAAVPELAEAVAEGLLSCSVETAGIAAFERTATSGKLRSVVDLR
ncbi:acyl-CoA reductase [Streptantibioticus cattleyicolor]|uniref:long-chain-fatty-acyl-CoA reductase n=1 Tax=Streptantibioticus cattleyicolor (strain ATCC 35852 / DSM 46488 / JCM 4925 / NBRC 14057 / NRRL 8057) TaxID=1003195 RepID=F8JK72_STREN|nr:acyl-CoA reductase [Streptantibioticus cattleyicolor]AEW98566.1 hypothetical protein SCATT_p03730 [Streptantibioticus cattleyicolor NRRL 8057 = DSM 46488]CCB72375.1 conserved protein of unknown function [Streptantibioticus cattleyicolor NRRL 8057 = DSM 46488]